MKMKVNLQKITSNNLFFIEKLDQEKMPFDAIFENSPLVFVLSFNYLMHSIIMCFIMQTNNAEFGKLFRQMSDTLISG